MRWRSASAPARSAPPERRARLNAGSMSRRNLDGDDHDRLVRPDASKLSGNRDLPVLGAWLLLRLLHLQRSRSRGGDRDADRRGDHRSARHHGYRAAQAVLLPDVPVRHRLRGGTAIRARHRAGWPSAGAVCRGGLRVLSASPPIVGAKMAGYDVGSAAGLYAGSQTISASMGLATDAINRLGLPPEETKKLLDAMPVAYAVTYIFGTVGSAIVLALLGPALLGIDLEAACKRYEEKHGGKKQTGGPGTAWHQFELRAFRVREDGPAVGKTVQEAEALLPEQRVFIQRIRRGGKIMDATADTVIQAGDIVADGRPARRAGQPDRRRRRRSRRSRAAGGAGRRRRCLRDQQGRRRQDAGRVGANRRRRAACSCARSPAARPRPTSRFCRTRSCSAATSSPSSDAPRTSRPRPRCWAIRTARPTWRTWRSSARRSRSAPCSARSSTRSAACRSRCPPPAAR